jgi:1-acyl-sn-glycerol-3-phosphate acyltransferase
VAARSLFLNPVLRVLIAGCNAFAIVGDTAGVKGVKSAIARLEARDLLLVFPEGTRTENGAGRAAVPLVPVHIKGALVLRSKGRLIPRVGRIGIAFGTPLKPENTAGDGHQGFVVGLKGEFPGCRIESS